MQITLADHAGAGEEDQNGMFPVILPISQKSITLRSIA